ncbi:MAG: segregation and condensation protein A, partial [Gammaproteobacteria bacterium]
ELVRRLQEYERYKQAAEDFDALPREGRDRFPVVLRLAGRKIVRLAPEVSFEALLVSFGEIMRRVALNVRHRIRAEPISIRQRMSDLLARLRDGAYVTFTALVNRDEGRDGIVISFLALLELARTGFAALTQAGAYGPLYVQARGLSELADDDETLSFDVTEEEGEAS